MNRIKSLYKVWYKVYTKFDIIMFAEIYAIFNQIIH